MEFRSMNRRDFLQTTAFAALSAVFAGSARDPFAALALAAEEPAPLDPNLVAIFSDIHVREPESSQQSSRFIKSVAQILATNPRPATLLIYGDVAYDAGKPEDYKIFRRMVEPLEKAGIRWEVAMGNHDRLENYRAVFPERFEKAPILENRHINIVETPRADFILLDSYLKGEVRGEIDPAQREWLGETLKEYVDKPVFVGCHHPLSETLLTETLLACPKFSGYLFGHWHWWTIATRENVPTVCFPSIGHWGDMGFVTLNLTEKNAIFTPTIDAYLLPGWHDRKPVEDVPAYLATLNAKIATLPLR